jgi:hypothetical protein
MTLRIANRRTSIVQAAVFVLVLAALRAPAVQSMVVGGLVEFGQITDSMVRLPCWLVDHSRCFSLDRFDPTCPQCL